MDKIDNKNLERIQKTLLKNVSVALKRKTNNGEKILKRFGLSSEDIRFLKTNLPSFYKLCLLLLEKNEECAACDRSSARKGITHKNEKERRA